MFKGGTENRGWWNRGAYRRFEWTSEGELKGFTCYASRSFDLSVKKGSAYKNERNGASMTAVVR